MFSVKVADSLRKKSQYRQTQSCQKSPIFNRKSPVFYQTTTSSSTSSRTEVARPHRVAVRCSALQCVAVRCSALQCVAVRCSALQCVTVRCSALQYVAVRYSTLQCAAVRCSAFQCVAVRCSALQCATVRYSTLQCAAVLSHYLCPSSTPCQPLTSSRSLTHIPSHTQNYIHKKSTVCLRTCNLQE